MTIIIRDSVVSDICGIQKISEITWLDTYPNQRENITINDVESVFKDSHTPAGKVKLEKRKKRYQDPNTQILVAEEGGKVISFCTAIREDGNGRIMAIYVLPSCQGRGIGKKLMSKALDWLHQDQDILINVARYNNQAIQFYKSFGFVETGRKGVFDSVARLPTGKVIHEIELKLSR